MPQPKKAAAELITQWVDHTRPNMGLTVWKGDVVRKADVTIAKNYLNQDEIAELNRIVTMLGPARESPSVSAQFGRQLA